MVRKSFYERGSSAGGSGRGSEPFVEIGWDEAFGLAAREIDRVRSTYGNGSIYGGSYGWASAGRFHHAQSQIHRFLNCAGGYTRSFSNYSHAAADVIVPHVIGDRRGLHNDHTPWSLIIANTKLLVMFGGTSHKNAQVSSGGISAHTLRESCGSGSWGGQRPSLGGYVTATGAARGVTARRRALMLTILCGSGSWGGQRPSLGGYVTATGAARGVTARRRALMLAIL